MPVHRRDRVEIVERARGLEHHRHEHLAIGEGFALGRRAGGAEVVAGAEPDHAAQARGRIARRRDDLGGMRGRFDLRAMQVPDADVEQARDPLAVRLGRPHGDREIEGAGEHRHVGDRLDRGRGMLHVDAREIEPRGLQQRQDRRVADQVDPGADLQLAPLDTRTYPVGSHGPPPGSVSTVGIRASRAVKRNAQYCSYPIGNKGTASPSTRTAQGEPTPRTR